MAVHYNQAGHRSLLSLKVAALEVILHLAT